MSGCCHILVQVNKYDLYMMNEYGRALLALTTLAVSYLLVVFVNLNKKQNLMYIHDKINHDNE